MDFQDCVSMLWPLSYLGPGISVELSGVPLDVVECLHNIQLEESCPLTALTKWVDTRQKVEQLTQLVKKAGLSNTGVQFLPTLAMNAFRSTQYHIAIGRRSEEEIIADNVTQAIMILANPKWSAAERRAKETLESMDLAQN